MLAELLPALEHQGGSPSILVGTSVGAINAVYLAAARHLGIEEAVAGAVSSWRGLSRDRVVRPLLSAGALWGGLVRRCRRSPRPRAGLADPSPLAESLGTWIDWASLHANVDKGLIATVAVVATAATSGHSVAFVEGRRPPGGRPSHLIDYFSSALGPAHVCASCAIPVVFPPVRIEEPAGARGWYFDGGTRLDTPIKPALDLGAERLVVVSTEAVTEPSTHPGRHDSRPPDLGTGALHLLQGALVVSPLIDDLRRLGDVNTYFADPEAAPAARRYRVARGKGPYRRIPYAFVAPPKPGQIARLAAEVFRSNYRGWRARRWPELALVNRLLGDETAKHGELLSYLLFDPEFIEELVVMGRADARAFLQESGPDGMWRTASLDAFIAGN